MRCNDFGQLRPVRKSCHAHNGSTTVFSPGGVSCLPVLSLPLFQRAFLPLPLILSCTRHEYDVVFFANFCLIFSWSLRNRQHESFDALICFGFTSFFSTFTKVNFCCLVSLQDCDRLFLQCPPLQPEVRGRKETLRKVQTAVSLRTAKVQTAVHAKCYQHANMRNELRDSPTLAAKYRF